VDRATTTINTVNVSPKKGLIKLLVLPPSLFAGVSLQYGSPVSSQIGGALRSVDERDWDWDAWAVVRSYKLCR